MISIAHRRAALLFLLPVAMMLVSCLSAAPDESDQQETSAFPTIAETQPSPAVTATFCPPPTPEPLWVEPVASPTDQLTQIIMVYIGNGEQVTIKTESGTFTATGEFNYHTTPAMVEITLLPNTVHHLEVTARVKPGLKGFGDCVYGGYTLTTRNDKNGAPLTVAQGTAAP